MGWPAYQKTLGAPKRRHLSVIKSTDLEPVDQPEETTQWRRIQSAAFIVVLCVAAGAVIAVAAFLGAS